MTGTIMLKIDKNPIFAMAFFILVFCLVTQAEAQNILLNGHWQQGGIIIGQAPLGSQVQLDDTTLALDNEGYFVFGLDRDAPLKVALTIIYPDKTEEKKTFTVSQRDYPKQFIEGVEQKYVAPSKEQVRRSQEDNRKVREARAKELVLTDYRATFVWPLIGPITGVFGSQRVYNGEPRRPHYGVDIAAPTGTIVKAPAGGMVTLAAPDMYFSGGTLIVDHGFGLSSAFLHLSKIRVKEGQRVEQGDIIAEVGATGRVTGAHLDWRMNWYDKRVDPALLVPDMQKIRAKRDAND